MDLARTGQAVSLYVTQQLIHCRDYELRSKRPSRWSTGLTTDGREKGDRRLDTAVNTDSTQYQAATASRMLECMQLCGQSLRSTEMSARFPSDRYSQLGYWTLQCGKAIKTGAYHVTSGQDASFLKSSFEGPEDGTAKAQYVNPRSVM